MLIIEVVLGIVAAMIILGAIGSVVSGSSVSDNSHRRTSGPVEPLPELTIDERARLAKFSREADNYRALRAREWE